MPAGTPWGAKWDYAWFKTSILLPPEASGQRIVFALYSVFNPMVDWNDAEEAVVWVNGVEVGALDFGHKEITLSENGQSGAKYEILMEVYAGHGPAKREVVPISLEMSLSLSPVPLKQRSKPIRSVSGARMCSSLG